MKLFFTQLRFELLKLFLKRRTHIGFVAFLGSELLMLVLCQLPMGQRSLRRLIEQNGGLFEHYFSGLTIAHIMLSMTLFFLGALFLGLVSGDLVAKEVEDGTMRMTLCRPISRVRIILLKYSACVIYTVCLVFFAGLTALGIATIMRGTGGMIIAEPEQKLVSLYEFGPGLVRFLGALVCHSIGLLTISSFTFLLSCCNMKPAAATILGIFVFFTDWILHFFPLFENYRPYLMATHISTWGNIYRAAIPWAQMVEDYAILVGLDVTFLVLALAVFESRDFKS